MPGHATFDRASRLSALLLISALLSDCSQRPSGPSSVTLSYEQEDTWCGNCPHYAVDFFDGQVRFFGLRGCAVPGEQVLRTPSSVFIELHRAFYEANFFSIPRLDTSGWTVHDARVITVAYRDEWRVHETIDAARHLPHLTRLEKRLADAAKIVDQLVNPSVEVYERLLRSGWNINTIGRDGENALTTVISRDPRIARFLLERGATVSREALVSSVFVDDVALFQALMDARKLDVKSDEGLERFVQAAGGSTAIMRLMLEKGANPDFLTRGRGTALAAAVSSGSLERVRLLLSKGADIRLADGVMLAAVNQDQSGMITLLAQHGADVNAQDPSGRTPLIVASDGCKYWHITPLLEAGADPFVKDKSGRTALQPEIAMTTVTESCKRSLSLLQDAVRKPRQPR